MGFFVSMPNENNMNRISYLDATKAIGMYLVYYGHFIEKLYYAGASSVFDELKLIYAFHVPLFFFLAGIFWKPDQQALGKIFFSKFKTRMMPTLFFGILAIPLFLLLDKFSVAAVMDKAFAYLYGQPKLNWVTWFLVCLFTLEMLIALIAKTAPFTNKPKAFVYATALFIMGWLLAQNGDAISLQTGMVKNFWFINEAFSAGGFYLLGYCAKDWLLKPLNRLQDGVGTLLFGGLLLATFNLNQGPFTDKHAIVLMNASSHGNYLWFVINALLGIAFIIFLMRFLDIKFSVLDYIGKNTLIYLGLNGFCLFFIDVKVIYKIGFLPTDTWQANLYALVYVTAIMLLFVPVTWLIKKFVPKWLVP